MLSAPAGQRQVGSSVRRPLVLELSEGRGRVNDPSAGHRQRGLDPADLVDRNGHGVPRQHREVADPVDTSIDRGSAGRGGADVPCAAGPER